MWGGEEPRTAFQDVGLFRLGQPDILECRVLWQRHSDSIDELRVPVTRVGLFKLAVKRLPRNLFFNIFLFLVVIFLEI